MQFDRASLHPVTRLLLALAVVFLLAFAWRMRHAGWMQVFTQTPSGTPAAIQFDNGPAPRAAASSPAAATPPPVRTTGALLKCKRGTETLYTNGDCPPGSTVLSADRGTVTVLNDQSALRARQTLDAAKPPAAEPDVKGKLIQRALGP